MSGSEHKLYIHCIQSVIMDYKHFEEQFYRVTSLETKNLNSLTVNTNNTNNSNILALYYKQAYRLI